MRSLGRRHGSLPPTHTPSGVHSTACPDSPRERAPAPDSHRPPLRAPGSSARATSSSGAGIPSACRPLCVPPAPSPKPGARSARTFAHTSPSSRRSLCARGSVPVCPARSPAGVPTPRRQPEGGPGRPCSEPGRAPPLTVRAHTGTHARTGIHAGGKCTRWGRGRGAAARAPGRGGSFLPPSKPARARKHPRNGIQPPWRGDRNATHPTPRPPRAPPPPPPGAPAAPAAAPARRGPAAAASPACAATWRGDPAPPAPARGLPHTARSPSGEVTPLGGARRFITRPDGGLARGPGLGVPGARPAPRRPHPPPLGRNADARAPPRPAASESALERAPRWFPRTLKFENPRLHVNELPGDSWAH